MSDWQLISSAPKDAVIDLWAVHTSCTWRQSAERLTDCRWRDESATYEEGWHDRNGNPIEWQVDEMDDEEDCPDEGRRVTHWMPRPSPPPESMKETGDE